MRQEGEYVGTSLFRDDNGIELQWHIYATPGSGLKFPASPDGREIYSKVEGEFFFEDEPTRIFRPVEE
jgi:hypothetical protein